MDQTISLKLEPKPVLVSANGSRSDYTVIIQGQWQLDIGQAIYTSLQTDNHAITELFAGCMLLWLPTDSVKVLKTELDNIVHCDRIR